VAGSVYGWAGGVVSDRVSDRELLRSMFLHLMTTDSATKDRRRKEFNQAIFHPEGWAIWSSTDLDMVMEKFDKACRIVRESEAS
jgi:hypothetical protein